MSDISRVIKNYLTSLWYDATYPGSGQVDGVPEPGKVKIIPENIKRIELLHPDQLKDMCHENTFRSLIERRSIRSFDESRPISNAELSYLLYCTQGVKNRASPQFRISPTGGAKCSIETYIYIENVENIENGLYYFLPNEHSLVCINRKNEEEFKKCLYSGNYFYSPITFIWTAVPYRLEWKYKERAYKILLLDAGHTCQNLYIASQSIGLGVCAVGAYRQKEMDEFLQIDGDSEFSVYCAPAGCPK